MLSNNSISSSCVNAIQANMGSLVGLPTPLVARRAGRPQVTSARTIWHETSEERGLEKARGLALQELHR